jgi:ribosomal protein S18 acetylase RimI-like enzyme
VDVEVRPATLERFDDVATLLGPKDPTASVCWCLSHRWSVWCLKVRPGHRHQGVALPLLEGAVGYTLGAS